jgi:Bacteriophage replication gene A protein (GPA)
VSRPLEPPVSSTQYPSNLRTKNVDGNPKTLAFSWSEVAPKAALGGPLARQFFIDGLLERAANSADRPIRIPTITAEKWAELQAAYVDPEDEKPSVGPKLFAPPKLDHIRKDRTQVIRFLPPELEPFLEKMKPARRQERELAILKKVGWEGLELAGMCAEAVAEKAKKAAAAYAEKFPTHDESGSPINQEPAHRKGRCEKTHRRKLRKLQRSALLYVEAALGAVGGPDVPGRPLYVSDYSVLLHRQQMERTGEILDGLRLIKTADPTVQIPLSELNEAAKIADVTKRRLLIDANLMRWAELGWHVCWITVTLPGRYVPHATNEERRAEDWDTNLGPAEAAEALQEMHHRTMALIRDKGVHPCGWWNSQPQQSGTPHRHIVLACQSLEDARGVCDLFWSRFSSTAVEQRQEARRREDHGCSAYVIGDTDARYAPPKGKNGEKETAASIARYAARYSTRYESKTDDVDKAAASGGSDQERFTAWKNMRRVRGHTWLGLDSGRAPMELWDTLWSNAQRSEYDPSDARMAIAMRLMREVKTYSEIATEARRSFEGLEFGDERDALSLTAQTAADDAAYAAWHAAVALGMWPDADLDSMEIEWLRDAVAEWNESNDVEAADPLPPLPLREVRDTIYGEKRKVTIGAFSAMTGEILLRTVDEWQIVDKSTAQRLVEESGTPEFKEKLRRKEIMNLYNLDGTPYVDEALGSEEVGLSFSPTDPRDRGCAPPHEGERVEDPPTG